MPGPRIRSRRTAPVIGITGAASGVGRALAARLADQPAVRRVVALDDHRGDLPSVTWRVQDLSDPGIAERLAGVDVLVHLAVDTGLTSSAEARRARNVHGTQTLVTAAAAAGVRRVVLLTSAMVYGAMPDNPVPLDEDGPLRATADGGLVGDFLAMEEVAERAPRTHAGLAVTVVRPAALVGPGVDSVLTRHFEAPRLLVVRGSRPRWQFCHVEDLARALEFAALERVTGAVTVGCEGWLEQADVEAVTGLRRIELPMALAFGTAERLHRIGAIPAPPGDLAYVVHPWVVPSTRLRAAGWKPTYDNVLALQALLDETAGHHALAARRVERRDAAVVGAGAAGAAVAVLGTAALIRRARRRRGLGL